MIGKIVGVDGALGGVGVGVLRRQALAHPIVDLGHQLRVLREERLHVLPALTELLALVGEPGARLLDEAEVDRDVEERPFAADPLAVHDVELGLLERRRALVLDDLDPGAVADHVGPVLDRLDPADVQPDRGVELQRTATRGDLGGVVDHDAVDEVVVAVLDLDVEAVHRARRRLDVDVGHRKGHQLVAHRREDGLDGEPAPVGREQLVLHARVDERGDQGVELRRLGVG